METDINLKFQNIENTLQIINQKLEHLYENKNRTRNTSELEEEIEEDIHCFFRFLRHFCCFNI